MKFAALIALTINYVHIWGHLRVIKDDIRMWAGPLFQPIFIALLADYWRVAKTEALRKHLHYGLASNKMRLIANNYQTLYALKVI